ncbi:hypothetical protein LAZ67_11001761 [Cordylochernes scorpioides]|uniref:Tf2-1-like SH3-like domain-containing protein n=1 Tax=Cordylochernes scorpioides TaxID=51811 RepID=A0ABY6L3J6_9ARAC|nr:hypothetical protein LAZ67_11001761 [Cordylochernes scorpioides]
MNKDEGEARKQEIGEFPNNDHRPKTLPPHLGTIILQLAIILERLQPLHPQDLDLNAFDVFSLPSPAITSSAQHQQSPEVFNSSRNPFQDKQKFNLNHKTPNFEVGDLVLVKVYHHPNTGKLAHYFTGPYTILEIISPNVVKINRPNQPLNKEHDTCQQTQALHRRRPSYSAPTMQTHYVQPKDNDLFPFRHLSSSQPLLPLIPNLFTLIQVEPTSSNNASPVPQLQINHEPTQSQAFPHKVDRITTQQHHDNIITSESTAAHHIRVDNIITLESTGFNIKSTDHHIRVDRMNQDDKEARVQKIGEFPKNDHGPTTLPPHLGTMILLLATILERLQPLHPRDLDLNAFDVFSLPSPAITSSAQHQKSPEVFNSSRNPFQVDLNHKTPNFEIGDLVLVKVYHHPNTGKLTPYFTGPYTILETISPNVVKINRHNQPLNKDHDTIHVNKLRPYTESIPLIAPPTMQAHIVQSKDNDAFPF